MFVVFNTRSSLLRTVALPHTPCPHCGRAGYLQVGVFGQAFCAGLFPVVPTGKFAKMHCGNCGQMRFENTLPPDLQAVTRQLKAESRQPLRHYFGLAALLGVWLVLGVGAWLRRPSAAGGGASWAENGRAVWRAASGAPPDSADYAWVRAAQRRGTPAQVRARLADPRPGDLITLQATADAYLLQRVVAVTPDSFRLQNARGVTTTLPARLELDKPGNYAPETFALPRDSAVLASLFASGRYVDVYRP